ncbi:pantoate--beta-alanine ligase [Flavobacterium agrisoli]|uniref:Pantothenate synthetase n=1 Tax=Flavobacterium agrisoli TaxID=2793066 RepID=A0A934PN56_9FLAO|nr:pantoate--beta-alanine ligase [Flavobacterium agrisoli]MBK0369478.1 pantoate--beta-alanine ligase [Flavobacterium agrisoli]
MHVFNGKADLIAHLNSIKTAHSTIGFVPTMGALHEGHLALMKRSLQDTDFTVVSIFVNPTQFNNPDDLVKYPRTLEADVAKMNQLNPDIIVYAPTVDDIYEGNTVSQHFDFDGLEFQMEGKFRPGHFDGVGTVVKRLFEIVKPDLAYFGEKDFQQLQIIKKLVSKYKLGIKIVGCPIFRESNQLAMSSRNERLTPEERSEASLIYDTLNEVKNRFQTESIAEISAWVSSVFDAHERFDLEYFVIADANTLETQTEKESNKNYRAFIAVFVNNVRLIDTISLN